MIVGHFVGECMRLNGQNLVAFALACALAVLQPVSFAQGEEKSEAQSSLDSQSQTQSSRRRTVPDYVDPEELSHAGAHGDEVAEWRKSEAISHYWVANSYFKRWNFDLAGVELQESIMYWPGLQASHKDLCLVYICTGHPMRALAQAMMCLGLGDPIPLTPAEQAQLNDNATKLHYRLGLKQGRDRKWTEAVTEFQWALNYTPTDPKIYRSLAFAYGNMGNFDKAEQFYQTTFNMSPGEAFSHADFAFMLADAGRSGQAREQLSEAVRLEPSAAALHVDLGWMSEAGGDLATAEKEFRSAIHLSPNHGGLWAHMGRILESEGKKAEAIEAFQRALRIDPGQDETKERLDKLISPAAS